MLHVLRGLEQTQYVEPKTIMLLFHRKVHVVNIYSVDTIALIGRCHHLLTSCYYRCHACPYPYRCFSMTNKDLEPSSQDPE